MTDKLKISTKALSLRKLLGLDTTSPIDIISVALTIPNLTLVFYPMRKHISGICIKNDGNPVIAINSTMSLGRQNFSLAHEFYHLYYDEGNKYTVSAKEIGSNNKTEKAADQFASYFLMPPLALSEMIDKIKSASTGMLGIREIVKLEQYFRVSRRALLFRLIEENILTKRQAEQFWYGVIHSAKTLGYDESLYKPHPEHKQHKTYGYYVQLAEELFQKDLISTGYYEELLLSAFRSDLVYGDESEGDELND